MSRRRERVDPKLLAAHLNTLPAPQRYDRTMYLGPKAKVLHARSAHRVHRNLKPLGDTSGYKAGIRAWSAQPGPEALRQGEKGAPDPRMEHKLRHVRDLVDVAPRGAPVLYRGVRLTPEQLAAYKPGSRHSYPVSSWTSDERLARRFAHHRRRLEPGQRPTVIHLQPGSRGVHIAPMATKYGLGMSEWLGRGNYEVVGSVDEGKRQVIHMRQVRHSPQRAYRRTPAHEQAAQHSSTGRRIS